MLKLSIGGLIMAAIHLAILAYTLAQIMTAVAGDWSVYWRIFLALDFPVSLAVVPLTWIVPPLPGGPFSDFPNFWWPLAVHGLLGTLWWYIVGMSIGDRLARFRARAQKGNDSQL
jgi:hypothetical protein